LVPQLHGSLQTLLKQALSDGHSVSATHPTLVNGGMVLQTPFPLLTYPSGHLQIIVRTGSESGTTVHLAGALHGL
jgi:hypothetical protein